VTPRLSPLSLLLTHFPLLHSEVFRKHHFRQAQMSSAMSLLKDIPAFNWYSYSKMSQIAYNLKSQSYHGRMTIVRAGQPVTNILLIHTGLIKVVDTSHHLSHKETDEEELPATVAGSPRSLLTKHVTSPLYVRELGRGQLIGETEVLKGLDCFEMSYEACGACEVFELSREHFEVVTLPPLPTLMK
jgi:CRP-like cAMP-binding protein